MSLLFHQNNAYTEEQKRQLTKIKLPILVVGEETELDLECTARYHGAYISVAVYNAEGIEIDFRSLKSLDRVIDAKVSAHGEIWTEPLSYKRVDERFFTELGRILNTSFSADLSDDPAVKVCSFVCGKEKYILLSNDEYIYNVCTVRTFSKIKSAKAQMKDNGYQVKLNENNFTVRIPPRCIELVRVEG